jgi:1-acyl-sn-glycerol-3-phosphate acyltransferase
MSLRALLFTDPLIVLFTIVLGTVSLVVSAFDKSGNAPHRVARLWSQLLLWAGGVRVRVEGLERLDLTRSYVLVANHQSLMDTPVVLAHIPLQFRFFAKQGLFRIPFLGTHLRRAGHLRVMRDDPRASLRILNEAARMMRERSVSMLLFPEGGRSAEGLQEFKEGAAHLAIRAGVPAVPIGIQGTPPILPIGSLNVRPGRVLVRVGQPVPTAGLRPHDRAALNAELRRRIAELITPAASPPAGISCVFRQKS